MILGRAGRWAPLLTSPHFAGGGIKALPREVGEGWVGGQRVHSTANEKGTPCPA